MNTDIELERRYRRLLALYPADFQAAYGEEMLATLAAGAHDGQRRPALREVASIVRGAGWQQLRAVARQLAGAPWQEALAAGGALFAIVLTALYAQGVVVVLAWRVRMPDWVTRVGPGHTAIALAAGWAIVTICILGGLRRIAAVGAWLGVIGQAIHTGLTGAPSIVVTSWWRLVLALTIAVALTPGMRRSAAPPLRVLRPALYGLVALLGLGAADVALAHVVATPDINSVGLYGGNFIMPFTPGTVWNTSGVPGLIGALAFIVGLTVSVFRLPGPVRGRVVVLGLPAVAAACLVRATFGGYLYSSSQFASPIPLFWGQWAALILIPLLAFAIAAAVLERTAQLRADARLGQSVRAAGERTRCVPAGDMPRSEGGPAPQ